MDRIIKFLRNEDGVTAIEYALIAALIAVVLVATLTNVGDQLIVIFGKIVTALTPAATP